jgi:hypothetical protein
MREIIGFEGKEFCTTFWFVFTLGLLALWYKISTKSPKLKENIGRSNKFLYSKVVTPSWLPVDPFLTCMRLWLRDISNSPNTKSMGWEPSKVNWSCTPQNM